MFGRVAACGIAAFLVFIPASSNGETSASTDAAAAAVPSTRAPQQQAENPTVIQPSDQATGTVREEGQAQEKVAALDPTELTNKSPPAVVPMVPTRSLSQPFGLATLPVYSGGLFTKWTGIEADLRAESKVFVRCRQSIDRCPSAAQKFLAIVAEGGNETGRARIGIINRGINLAIRPMSDLVQWGVVDRWSAPLETFTTGLGDCEDYAIAKYVALTEAGVAAEDVRLVIVHDRAVGEDHAVATVRLDGKWIVLDNRWLTMVDDTDLNRLEPLFVLDQTGVRAALRMPAPNVQRVSAPRQGVAAMPGSLD